MSCPILLPQSQLPSLQKSSIWANNVRQAKGISHLMCLQLKGEDENFPPSQWMWMQERKTICGNCVIKEDHLFVVTFLPFFSIKWLCSWMKLKPKPLISSKPEILLDSAVIKVWGDTKETFQNIPALKVQSHISAGWRWNILMALSIQR